MNDNAFARAHAITVEEAIAYRHGYEANRRGSALITSHLMSRYDAWYAAGWSDADIAHGHSVLEGNAA